MVGISQLRPRSSNVFDIDWEVGTATVTDNAFKSAFATYEHSLAVPSVDNRIAVTFSNDRFVQAFAVT
jgi:hypothetical protein